MLSRCATNRTVAAAVLRSAPNCSAARNFDRRRGLATLPSSIQPLFQYAAECNITTAVQTAMEAAHATGLPWAATIIGTGVVLRLITAPLHIQAERVFARRLHATNYMTQKILEKLGGKYRVKVAPNKEGTALELKTDDDRIIQAANKTLATSVSAALVDNKLQSSRIQNLKMCSVPVWIFSSFALRNIISSDFHSAVPGGLWFPDLLVPDPFYILPVAVGLMGFLNLWSQRKIYPVVGGRSPFATKAYDSILAFFTCFAVYIMTQLPACIPLYWLTVSATGMAQAQLLRHPVIKKVLGINRLPTDSRTPIRDLFLLRRQTMTGMVSK